MKRFLPLSVVVLLVACGQTDSGPSMPKVIVVDAITGKPTDVTVYVNGSKTNTSQFSSSTTTPRLELNIAPEARVCVTAYYTGTIKGTMYGLRLTANPGATYTLTVKDPSGTPTIDSSTGGASDASACPSS